MYNLFVDGNIEAWQGEPWIIEATRCVNEYTDNAIIERFGQLDEASIQALKKCRVFLHTKRIECKIQNLG
jgi:uncharacterized phage-associated protein